VEDLFSIGHAMAALEGRSLSDEFGKLTSEIQRLLAVEPVTLPGIQVGVRTAPARIVGGDYVDVVRHPGAAPIFGIGEISGKSLPAALKAFALKFVIRSLIAGFGDGLPEVLSRANHVRTTAVDADEFASALLCRFGEGNRSLIVANAGHDPPLVFRAARGDSDEMEPGGLVLGVRWDETYVEQTSPLELGDTVVLYTDGFTEARNAAGEQFTLAQVKRGLQEFSELPVQALADALFERIERFTEGTLRDDASIMLMRVVA
jgi:sigma-B regulation protein RsbU (phosphoserine phosphatase)